MSDKKSIATFIINIRSGAFLAEQEIDNSVFRRQFEALGREEGLSLFTGLRGMDLSEARLSKANLSDADLVSADFEGAHLHGADLQRSCLQAASLREAVLHGADLRNADLQDSVFADADLREADLRGAWLKGADFRGANLQGAKITFSQVGELARALAALPGKGARAIMVAGVIVSEVPAFNWRDAFKRPVSAIRARALRQGQPLQAVK